MIGSHPSRGITHCMLCPLLVDIIYLHPICFSTLFVESLKGSAGTRRLRFTVCINVNNQTFKPGLITWPTPFPALNGKEKSLKPQAMSCVINRWQQVHHTLCPEEDSYRKEAVSQVNLNFVRMAFNPYKRIKSIVSLMMINRSAMTINHSGSDLNIWRQGNLPCGLKLSFGKLLHNSMAMH